MFLRVDGIHALATRLLTGRVLLGKRAGSHGAQLEEFGLYLFNLGFELFFAHGFFYTTSII